MVKQVPHAEYPHLLSKRRAFHLLQLFQMNRKSGHVRIHLEGMDSPAAVTIRAGQVIDASVPLRAGGAVVGEKAFYRIGCCLGKIVVSFSPSMIITTN